MNWTKWRQVKAIITLLGIGLLDFLISLKSWGFSVTTTETQASDRCSLSECCKKSSKFWPIPNFVVVRTHLSPNITVVYPPKSNLQMSCNYWNFNSAWISVAEILAKLLIRWIFCATGSKGSETRVAALMARNSKSSIVEAPREPGQKRARHEIYAIVIWWFQTICKPWLSNCFKSSQLRVGK